MRNVTSGKDVEGLLWLFDAWSWRSWILRCEVHDRRGVLVPHPRLHYSEVPTPTATVWQPDLIHHLLFGLYCFFVPEGLENL